MRERIELWNNCTVPRCKGYLDYDECVNVTDCAMERKKK